MKTQIETVEFTFKRGESIFRVKWQYIGTKELSCVNYKNWRVSVINNWDGSGIANKVIGDIYHTTLQPNLSNSQDHLKRALQ
jgi:hypothetical protein